MEDNIDLKIKFVQTDLTDKGYIYRKMMQQGNIFNPSLIYENSDFLLKLNALNNFTGGTLATAGADEKSFDKGENSGSNMSAECSRKNSATLNGSEYIADGKEYTPDEFVFCYDDDAEDEYYFDVDIDGDFDELGELDEQEELENQAEVESDDDINFNEVKVEFNTTGKMSVLKNQITITYDEGDLFGFRNAMVNIMMDSKNPDIITIQKDNLIKSTLTLEKDKRSISDYDNSSSPVTVAVKTLKMMNNMTKKGGEIDLLYTIEANGSPTEMVSYSLSAQKKIN